MKLNLIIGNRSDRLPRLINELDAQGISDYEFWDGVYLPSIKASINAAHRQIIQYAKLAGWDETFIAEDDIKFSAAGAWDYFLKQKPESFDIYLGGIFLGEPDEKGIVKDFTGMTCYCVSKHFYETFLSVDPYEHIDRSLSGKGKFMVCEPFICTQWDGISGNTGKEESYGYLQRNRNFFTGY